MPIMTLEDMLVEELGGSRTEQERSPEPAAREESFPYPVFDLHCDTADRLAWQTLDGSLKRACGLDFYGPDDEKHPDEVRELARNRGHISLEKIGDTPWIQCFATFVPDELTAAQALDFWHQVSSYLARQVEENREACTLLRRTDSLGTAHAAYRLVAVPTVENARMLALDPALAGELADAGVRMASISWNAAGPLASGHDTLDGVTPAGRTAVSALVREGIVVDVSHLNDVCFGEVASLVDGPIVASHSNSRAVCRAPRNLTDAQFSEIRDRGGLVGINFCRDFLAESDAGIDDIARHIEHFLDLDGEDVLALGSDFDGCDVPDCVRDASRMPDFERQLIHFFGDAITRKICYGNALAFFETREARR